LGQNAVVPSDEFEAFGTGKPEELTQKRVAKHRHVALESSA
jgi:hypothetical protein